MINHVINLPTASLDLKFIVREEQAENGVQRSGEWA